MRFPSVAALTFAALAITLSVFGNIGLAWAYPANTTGSPCNGNDTNCNCSSGPDVCEPASNTSPAAACAADCTPTTAPQLNGPPAPAGTVSNGSGSAASSTTIPAPVTLDNPIGFTNINQAIGGVINIILGLSGAVALLMFVWGGVQWLISGGNADRIKAGKSTLTWAALGIVVIFLAYTLVTALVMALSGVSPT